MIGRLESLAMKLDALSDVQSKIQQSFNNLESRHSFTPPVDDVPQCGRRVDRVLRTLTPLVSRVESLWNVVSGYPVNINSINSNSMLGSAKQQSSHNINVAPSQFLNAEPNSDALLSESRRQERAISAIRTDLNLRVSLLCAFSAILKLIC